MKNPAVRRVFGHPLLWTFVAFALLPFLVPGGNLFTGHIGFVELGSQILIFALFALGFNLLFGHTGELSFGHAMFFTLGAYTTALYTKGFNVDLLGRTWTHGAGNNLIVALILSLVVGLLWATLLARIIVARSSGIYFSMITLAFAQVIYFITYKWSALTGGEDGIQAIPRPQIPGFPPDFLGDRLHFFFFTFAVVFVMSALVYWIIVSPFGSVCHAIRENKLRARFLGYDVNKYRVNMFVLSAAFPIIGGWMWTYFQQAINPDAGSIEYSGNIVMMSLLGGIQTFFGPVLGAFVYWQLQNRISQFTVYWEAAIGVVFAVFVLIAPRGLMGFVEDIQHYGFTNFLRRTVSKEARIETEAAEELPPVVEEAVP